MAKKYEFKPDWVSKPGDSIISCMKEQEYTIESLSKELRISQRRLLRIIRDHEPIDYEMACGLAITIGSSPNFWMRRQEHYDKECKRLGIK